MGFEGGSVETVAKAWNPIVRLNDGGSSGTTMVAVGSLAIAMLSAI